MKGNEREKESELTTEKKERTEWQQWNGTKRESSRHNKAENPIRKLGVCIYSLNDGDIKAWQHICTAVSHIDTRALINGNFDLIFMKCNWSVTFFSFFLSHSVSLSLCLSHFWLWCASFISIFFSNWLLYQMNAILFITWITKNGAQTLI